MDVLLGLLMLVGLAISSIASLFIASIAFRKSLWWGLAYFIVPFASFVFIGKYWDETKRTFYVLMGGLLLAMGVGWIEFVRISNRPPASVAGGGSMKGAATMTEAMVEEEVVRISRKLTPPARRSAELSAIRTGYRDTIEARLRGRARVAR